jgi:hypothetical protein
MSVISSLLLSLLSPTLLAYLVQALAGLRISRRSAEVLVQALSLIAEEQSFFYPVVGAEDDISCDTSGTALDGLSRQEAHPTIATTSPVTSPSSLTGRSIAPTLPGRAILSGPSAPSVILAPPPPPALQQWYRVYRGYVYNYPMPTELNRGSPFYCVTKGLRVGIFTDWCVLVVCTYLRTALIPIDIGKSRQT